jgi:hypothetical protein
MSCPRRRISHVPLHPAQAELARAQAAAHASASELRASRLAQAAAETAAREAVAEALRAQQQAVAFQAQLLARTRAAAGPLPALPSPKPSGSDHGAAGGATTATTAGGATTATTAGGATTATTAGGATTGPHGASDGGAGASALRQQCEELQRRAEVQAGEVARLQAHSAELQGRLGDSQRHAAALEQQLRRACAAAPPPAPSSPLPAGLDVATLAADEVRLRVAQQAAGDARLLLQLRSDLAAAQERLRAVEAQLAAERVAAADAFSAARGAEAQAEAARAEAAAAIAEASRAVHLLTRRREEEEDVEEQGLRAAASPPVRARRSLEHGLRRAAAASPGAAVSRSSPTSPWRLGGALSPLTSRGMQAALDCVLAALAEAAQPLSRTGLRVREPRAQGRASPASYGVGTQSLDTGCSPRSSRLDQESLPGSSAQRDAHGDSGRSRRAQPGRGNGALGSASSADSGYDTASSRDYSDRWRSSAGAGRRSCRPPRASERGLPEYARCRLHGEQRPRWSALDRAGRAPKGQLEDAHWPRTASLAASRSGQLVATAPAPPVPSLSPVKRAAALEAHVRDLQRQQHELTDAVAALRCRAAEADALVRERTERAAALAERERGARAALAAAHAEARAGLTAAEAALEGCLGEARAARAALEGDVERLQGVRARLVGDVRSARALLRDACSALRLAGTSLRARRAVEAAVAGLPAAAAADAQGGTQVSRARLSARLRARLCRAAGSSACGAPRTGRP